jgi:anti-sigma factor ChrR (cupin superfamily)
MSNIARIDGPDVNADLLELITIDSDQVPWQPTGVPGLSEKVFERIGGGGAARETALLRLQSRATVPGGVAQCRIDMLVLAGGVELAGTHHAAGMFVRVPAGTEISLRSTEGATVLVKKRGGQAAGEPIVLDTRDRANWAAWGGRGSEKAQLYDAGPIREASWVGYMLPDLTIPEHDHVGGEEIFILQGELRDERGLYGPGVWIRFPIGLRHTPTSLAEGCRMLVREGDAHPLH